MLSEIIEYVAMVTMLSRPITTEKPGEKIKIFV